MTTENEKPINQKQGVVNKCPSCGGVLKAFASVCELCGHELAGVAASKTISDLVEKFGEIESEVNKVGMQGNAREKEIVIRKARVIRDFPIPNSRSELQSLIYFIHPKIQDNVKPDLNADDWRVKFNEVMTLAKNAYRGDAKTRAEFDEIERSLNTSISAGLQTRAKRYPLVAIGLGLVIVVAIVGIVVSQLDQWKQKQCEDRYAQGEVTENARLDGIVALTDARYKEKKFSEALAGLNQLRWSYQEPCRVAETESEKVRWDGKRKELSDQVQQGETIAMDLQREAAERESAEKRAAADRESTEKKAAVDREQAEKQVATDRELAKKREATDRDLEEGLSSRAKAAATARKTLN